MCCYLQHFGLLLLACFDVLLLVHFHPHYSYDYQMFFPHTSVFLLLAIMLFDSRHLLSPNYMVVISI